MKRPNPPLPLRPRHQMWLLRLNDSETQTGLWLRFSILLSRNGFRQLAEVRAILFHKDTNQSTQKTVVKQTFDIQAFRESEAGVIRIGNCELSAHHCRGKVESKQNSMEWELTFNSPQKLSFNAIPEILKRFKLIQRSMDTVDENLVFSGSTKVNGERITWKEAPGILRKTEGPQIGYSWVWGQSNLFTNEMGQPVPFIFEGFSGRTRLGPFLSPRLSSFYFYYEGKPYVFNTLRDSFAVKSNPALNEWSFQVDRGDLSFRGQIRAEHKDFAGMALEDTDGSYLYCNTTNLSDLRILVYRRGKLEATLVSTGNASFDVASPEKNPYVPILV